MVSSPPWGEFLFVTIDPFPTDSFPETTLVIKKGKQFQIGSLTGHFDDKWEILLLRRAISIRTSNCEHSERQQRSEYICNTFDEIRKTL